MSSRDPLPEPWRSALEPKGISSRRDLANKAGIAVQTAIRLVNGEGSPSQATVDAVARELFNGDRNRVRELAGLSGHDHGEWRVPDEIALLDPQQRAAVEAVIKAMVPQELRRGEPGGDTAATTVTPIDRGAEMRRPQKRAARKDDKE